MSERNETLAEVLAEMRIFKCRNLETGELELCNAIANYFADRIEAAAKRERATAEKSSTVGNAAAMREVAESALIVVRGIIDGTLSRRNQSVFDCRDKLKSAIAKPPRNCDVGTAEEQAERCGRYCDKFTSDRMHCENCPCCGKIPFGRCEFAWAQMPYEEGGAK